MPKPLALLSELATLLEEIRKDHPLRVAVDGVDAVGKTTFADALALEIRKLGRAVIRASVDGFHNPSAVRYRQGKTSPRGYFKDSFNYPALKANLLEPLGPQGSLKYRSQVFDYRTDSEVLSPQLQAPPQSILIFDGVFLQCEELRGCWDFVIWLDANFETTVARALARNKNSTHEQYAERYVPGQRMYIAECRPRESAHVVINNADFDNPDFMRNRDFDLGGKVPPWGRNAEEYEMFFALENVPSTARVLDCGGGPASFTAEWSRQGHFVVAADPAYQLSAAQIAADFEPTAVRMLDGMRKAYGRFNWDHYKSPEDVLERRRTALRKFVQDYGSPEKVGCYVASLLPDLPFAADSFDLVLCAHMLFLYAEEFSLEMHIASLQEMLRVGREVRVFPLLNMQGERSIHLDPCMKELAAMATVEIVPVPFEFRPGDSNMLRLTRRPCN
jgi:uridine kinase